MRIKYKDNKMIYYNPVTGEELCANYREEIFRNVSKILQDTNAYKSKDTEITWYNPIDGKKEKFLKENILTRLDNSIFPGLGSFDLDFNYIQFRVDVGVILNDYIKYEVEGGFLYFNEVTGSIDWCDNYVTKAIIPEKINGVEVTSIRGICLDKIHPVFLGNMGGAFWGNEDLEEVFIPKSVKKIGCGAFKDCKSLNKLDMECGVEIIEKSAFEDAFTDDAIINLPNSIKVIDDYAFYPCNCKILENFKLPKSIEYIGECAFYKTFKNIYFPENVKNIKFIAETAFYLKNTNFFVYDEVLKNYVKYEIEE